MLVFHFLFFSPSLGADYVFDLCLSSNFGCLRFDTAFNAIVHLSVTISPSNQSLFAVSPPFPFSPIVSCFLIGPFSPVHLLGHAIPRARLSGLAQLLLCGSVQ